MSATEDAALRRGGDESPPRLQQIAAAAGVSQATVSRVLNNEPHVAEETRHQVLRVIAEAGYVPHLREGHTQSYLSYPTAPCPSKALSIASTNSTGSQGFDR